MLNGLKNFFKTKKTIKEISIYGFGNILSRSITYFLVPLHTSLLSPSGYGVISEMYSYIAFLQIIYSLGFDSAYFRFARVKSYKNFAKTFTIISSIFFSIIIYGFLYISGFLEKISSATSIYPLYIIICLLILITESLLNIYFLQLRHKSKTIMYSKMKLLQVVFNVVFNFFTFFIHLNFLKLEEKYLVSSVFISNLVSSLLILLIFNIKEGGFRMTFSKKLVIRSIRFGFPFVYMSLILICNDLISKIALRLWLPSNLFLGKTIDHTIGIISVCQKVSTIISLGTQAYRYTIEPFLFRGSALKRKYYDANLFWYTLFGCLMIIIISLNLNIIGRLFLRRRDYYLALNLVPTLLISNLLNGIYYNLSFWTKTLNKLKISTLISTINFVSNIFFSYIFVPKYGHWGIAISPLLSGFLSCLLAFFLARHYNIYFRIFFITILLVITAFLSNYFVNTDFSNITILKNFFLSMLISFIVLGGGWFYRKYYVR